MKEFFKTKTLFKIIIFLVGCSQIGEWIAYLILFIREALLCKC